MGALTTLADRSVAKLTEEEIIRRVVQSLADAAPAFPEGPGGDCAHLPTTGGRSIRASTIDSVILGRHFDAACDGIRAGAKLVNVVSNSIVPKLTVIVGGSYGAGNYALCGKAFDPLLILAWLGLGLAAFRARV